MSILISSGSSSDPSACGSSQLDHHPRLVEASGSSAHQRHQPRLQIAGLERCVIASLSLASQMFFRSPYVTVVVTLFPPEQAINSTLRKRSRFHPVPSIRSPNKRPWSKASSSLASTKLPSSASRPLATAHAAPKSRSKRPKMVRFFFYWFLSPGSEKITFSKCSS